MSHNGRFEQNLSKIEEILGRMKHRATVFDATLSTYADHIQNAQNIDVLREAAEILLDATIRTRSDLNGVVRDVEEVTADVGNLRADFDAFKKISLDVDEDRQVFIDFLSLQRNDTPICMLTIFNMNHFTKAFGYDIGELVMRMVIDEVKHHVDEKHVFRIKHDTIAVTMMGFDATEVLQVFQHRKIVNKRTQEGMGKVLLAKREKLFVPSRPLTKFLGEIGIEIF
jgi:GGDEF domain-containing protein